MKLFDEVVHGAHGKPLQIAGKTQHLNLQWGEARGRASFIVIISLESPPVLIGMDIMQPLRVNIDVTRGTATPTQPDPQTIHLNTAQTPHLPQSATVYYYRPSIFQQKQHSQSVATTLGPTRMYTSALKKAYPRMSQEYPPLPVDLRFGSPFIITDPNPSAYTQDKP